MLKYLITSAFLVLSSGAHAYEDQMLEYIDWITENSDFKYNGEELPEVLVTSLDLLQILAFGEETVAQAEREGRPINPVFGVYRNDIRTILLNEEYLEDIEPVLVHELVHYLQDINQGLSECPGNDEKIAYELHWKWLQDHPEYDGRLKDEPDWFYVFFLKLACDQTGEQYRR